MQVASLNLKVMLAVRFFRTKFRGILGTESLLASTSRATTWFQNFSKIPSLCHRPQKHLDLREKPTCFAVSPTWSPSMSKLSILAAVRPICSGPTASVDASSSSCLSKRCTIAHCLLSNWARRCMQGGAKGGRFKKSSAASSVCSYYDQGLTSLPAANQELASAKAKKLSLPTAKA